MIQLEITKSRLQNLILNSFKKNSKSVSEKDVTDSLGITFLLISIILKLVEIRMRNMLKIIISKDCLVFEFEICKLIIIVFVIFVIFTLLLQFSYIVCSIKKSDISY